MGTATQPPARVCSECIICHWLRCLRLVAGARMSASLFCNLTSTSRSRCQAVRCEIKSCPCVISQHRHPTYDQWTLHPFMKSWSPVGSQCAVLAGPLHNHCVTWGLAACSLPSSYPFRNFVSGTRPRFWLVALSILPTRLYYFQTSDLIRLWNAAFPSSFVTRESDTSPVDAHPGVPSAAQSGKVRIASPDWAGRNSGALLRGATLEVYWHLAPTLGVGAEPSDPRHCLRTCEPCRPMGQPLATLIFFPYV